MSARISLSIITFLFFMLWETCNSFSQSNLEQDNNTPENIKSGFSWGVIPAFTYDSDLGLKYGGVVNLFDYGNGDQYPKYIQYLRIRLFNTTNGTSHYSAIFDTEKLFANTKVIAEVSLINDIALDFYGFNGKNSIINHSFINPDNDSYINKYFYNHQRQWFRSRLDFHRKLFNSGYSIFLGITYNSFAIQSINPNKLKIPQGPDGNEPSTESLYHKYSEWGIISEAEKNGGRIGHFSLGIIYDSRNNQLNCSNGIWMETYLLYSPDVFDNKSFAKHILTFRQYLDFEKSDMILSYRISSQQKLWGKIPFYYLPVFFDSQNTQEGLGGAYTLRGASRNRIETEGFVLGNIEIRRKLFSISVLKLRIDIEASIFSDIAIITQEFDVDHSLIPSDYIEMFINPSYQRLYITYGPGLYLIYDMNNIISINYGFSHDKQLGYSGLYIGSSFLF